MTRTTTAPRGRWIFVRQGPHLPRRCTFCGAAGRAPHGRSCRCASALAAAKASRPWPRHLPFAAEALLRSRRSLRGKTSRSSGRLNLGLPAGKDPALVHQIEKLAQFIARTAQDPTCPEPARPHRRAKLVCWTRSGDRRRWLAHKRPEVMRQTRAAAGAVRNAAPRFSTPGTAYRPTPPHGALPGGIVARAKANNRKKKVKGHVGIQK